MLNLIFIFLGTLFLVLGILGIVIPGLPTTPFLLLSASLYLRSSEKLYNRLISNPWLGKYILNYRRNKGMSKKQKLYSMVIMWGMISISCIFFLDAAWSRLLVLALGVVGTFVMVLLPCFRK